MGIDVHENEEVRSLSCISCMECVDQKICPKDSTISFTSKEIYEMEEAEEIEIIEVMDVTGNLLINIVEQNNKVKVDNLYINRVE